MRIIYLAGGMNTGWRNVIKEGAPMHAYIDPTTHGYSDPDKYTEWDMDGVDRAELVIAVMENDNPSGIGLAAEVGRASAAGTEVWFVDLMFNNKLSKYFDIVRSLSEYQLTDLDDVVYALATWGRFNN